MSNVLRDAALAYAATGWPVIPLKAGGKTPLTKHGYKDATTEADIIKKWWRKWPNANIGIVTTRASGICAIDCDVDKETGELGEDTLVTLENENSHLPLHPVSRTPSGGLHHWLKYPDDGDFPRSIKPHAGIDFLGSRIVDGDEIGGYIVAPPSARPDGEYEWIVSPDKAPLPSAPAWVNILARYRRERPAEQPRIDPVVSDRTTPYGRKVLDECCATIASAMPGSQDDTLIRMATRVGSVAAGGQIDYNEAQAAVINAGLAMANQAGRERWTHGTIQKKVARAFEHASRDPYSPQPRQTSAAMKDKDKRPRQPDDGGSYKATAANSQGPRLASSNDNPVDWRDGLPWVLTRDGGLKPSAVRNAQLMIEHHPQTRGIYRYNEFSDIYMMTRALIPADNGRYPRQVADHDEVALCAWLNNCGLSIAITTVAAVLREIAMRNAYDPLKDYLNGLEWDGEPRLDGWLPHYCTARRDQYAALVGRKFLISAVARALAPGEKADTMMILEGAQGIGKSTVGRILAGPEYFIDQVGDVTNKDSSALLQGAWIVEIPEMDKFTRAEANAVKDFLSRREDRYRPAYGRNVILRPRRCVFLGTINPDGVGYLRDTTGNRRFWPVAVGDIKLNALEQDRDQLWAEAVYAYRSDEEWWIAEADAAVVISEQDARRDADVWEPHIQAWLASPGSPDYFTASQCLYEAVGVETRHQKHAEKIRVAKILRLLGCHEMQHKNGIKGRSWARKID